jgi:hypothetical protein
MVELALVTGIPPSVWIAEEPETIMTALELLAERDG